MSHYTNLRDLGFTVIRGFLSPDEVNGYRIEAETIASKIGSHASAAPVGLQNSIKGDRIINNIHYHSDRFLNLSAHGKHIEVLKPFLNDEYYGLIPKTEPNFILAQCNCRESTTQLQYHVDVRLKLADPKPWSMQCILALESRTKDNGGLSVIEGSHRRDRAVPNKEDHQNEVFVDLKAGDMVIFHSHLLHGTTKLKKKFNPAWGLLLTYRCWWCKPQFDFVAMFGSSKVEQLDNRTKTLLGYYSQPGSDPFASPSARQGYS